MRFNSIFRRISRSPRRDRRRRSRSFSPRRYRYVQYSISFDNFILKFDFVFSVEAVEVQDVILNANEDHVPNHVIVLTKMIQKTIKIPRMDAKMKVLIKKIHQLRNRVQLQVVPARNYHLLVECQFSRNNPQVERLINYCFC